MPFERSWNKKVDGDKLSGDSAKESTMGQSSPLSGVYREEEDVGEVKRSKAYEPPPYIYVKKPREKLTGKPKKKADRTAGPYDAPKPDPVDFQRRHDEMYP